jgi:Holliday junction resolvase RusA-like endonuclease
MFIPHYHLIDFFVSGSPIPQGSKSFAGMSRSRKPIMKESSKYLQPWRAMVCTQGVLQMDKDGLKLDPAIKKYKVYLAFHFQRPLSHYVGDNRERGILKPDAPKYWEFAQTPDVDKLARAILDALTGVVWPDDKMVDIGAADRMWVDEQDSTREGVSIAVRGIR